MRPHLVNDLLVGYSTNPKAKQKKKTLARKRKFHWGDEQQASFDTIIGKLISPPILAYADYNKPFSVHTDASSNGLGAALYQLQEGKERVVAYAFGSLKQSERNYPAHKLEFLALKWAV